MTEPIARLLVVDDDRALARALVVNLRVRGYAVAAEHTGEGALRAVAADVPDLVVLDLGLPDLDGVDVVGGLRGWTRVPILVLSARSDQADKVRALDAGADDYLTKPFGMDELLARIRAALRRNEQPVTHARVETAAFTVDLAARQVLRDGVPVRLTPTEWHVLEVLARHVGQLVGQRELLRAVWGPAYEKETHYLRVYLSGLRRKLEPDPGTPRHLLTEPGLGYRLQP